MNRSMPGLPVHHQLLELTQTNVHWVGDAIQPPHPLSSPSPPALNLPQHQGLFQWDSSSHQVAKVLARNNPSNEYTGLISFRIDWLDILAIQVTLKILLQHQFFGPQPSLCSNSHIDTRLWENPDIFVGRRDKIAHTFVWVRKSPRHTPNC